MRIKNNKKLILNKINKKVFLVVIIFQMVYLVRKNKIQQYLGKIIFHFYHWVKIPIL
jgi:hypothetical protein